VSYFKADLWFLLIYACVLGGASKVVYLMVTFVLDEKRRGLQQGLYSLGVSRQAYVVHWLFTCLAYFLPFVVKVVLTLLCLGLLDVRDGVPSEVTTESNFSRLENKGLKVSFLVQVLLFLY
jgi:hypothetical protein